MLYSDLLTATAENSPSQMRRLLTEAGDMDSLREWDSSRMSEKAGSDG